MTEKLLLLLEFSSCLPQLLRRPIKKDEALMKLSSKSCQIFRIDRLLRSRTGYQQWDTFSL